MSASKIHPPRQPQGPRTKPGIRFLKYDQPTPYQDFQYTLLTYRTLSSPPTESHASSAEEAQVAWGVSGFNLKLARSKPGWLEVGGAL